MNRKWSLLEFLVIMPLSSLPLGFIIQAGYLSKRDPFPEIAMLLVLGFGWGFGGAVIGRTCIFRFQPMRRASRIGYYVLGWTLVCGMFFIPYFLYWALGGFRF